jgi:hypothetical protein
LAALVMTDGWVVAMIYECHDVAKFFRLTLRTRDMYTSSLLQPTRISHYIFVVACRYCSRGRLALLSAIFIPFGYSTN